MSTDASNKNIQDQMTQLFSSIVEQQNQINEIRPSGSDKAHLVKSNLDEFTRMRGIGFFYNYLSSGEGNGPFTKLIDDSVKYDLIGGMGINLVGHAHPIYLKAHLEAIKYDSVICGNLLAYTPVQEASRKLLDSVSKTNLKHFWFACSGGFANDNALKILWQKTSPKYRIISFNKAFAGRTIATQNITFNPAYSDGMPKAIEVDHVPHFDINDPKNSLEKTLTALDKLWKENPDSYSAMCIELIQGEAGFVFGTEDYYRGIFEWAKERDIYIWVDEIQSFGRTHQLFAFQMFNLDEYVDVVTVGKALQVCGTFFTEKLNPKPGLLGGTYVGSIASLIASSNLIHYLTSGNFFGDKGRNKEMEEIFVGRLRHLAKKTCKGKIGYAGGIGAMISFEVGDSSKEVTANFLKALFNNGIIAYSAGKDPTRVRLLPPLIISNEQIEEIFKIIETTALQVL